MIWFENIVPILQYIPKDSKNASPTTLKPDKLALLTDIHLLNIFIHKKTWQYSLQKWNSLNFSFRLTPPTFFHFKIEKKCKSLRFSKN